MTPFKDIIEYKTYKDCLLAGNTRSHYIIKEIPDEDMKKEGFNLKFTCIEQKVNKLDT